VNEVMAGDAIEGNRERNVRGERNESVEFNHPYEDVRREIVEGPINGSKLKNWRK